MLDYMGLHEDADRMQAAIEEALKSPENRTKDLGGSAGTKEFTQAIIKNLS
jgi:isocitrate dehydrogenase (NAD+)